MTSWRLALSALLAIYLGAFPERTMASEQVPYTVEQTLPSGVEIRSYAETVVAETLIDGGSYADAGNAGFRLLAGYIFGGNQSEQKIAMTAPVAMAASDAEQRTMTESLATANGSSGWRVSFFMPAGATLETLPTPRDARVKLRTVPGRRVAALRFSGRGTVEQFAVHTAELREALATAGIPAVGAPWTARYNAPWVPPMLRRNEAMIEVAPRP